MRQYEFETFEFKLNIDNLTETQNTQQVGDNKPAYSQSGAFSSSKLCTSDASLWLRDVLKLGRIKNEQMVGVSSHSLKATPLSWCAKFGLDVQTSIRIPPCSCQRVGSSLF